MTKKSRLVIIYCILCSVIFMAAFSLLSYHKRLPGAGPTVIFVAAYCVLTLIGAWLIISFGGASQSQNEPPKTTSRSITHLLSVMKTPVAVTDGSGRIVWHNNAFSDLAQDKLGKNSDLQSLCGVTLKELLSSESPDGVDHNDAVVRRLSRSGASLAVRG